METVEDKAGTVNDDERFDDDSDSDEDYIDMPGLQQRVDDDSSSDDDSLSYQRNFEADTVVDSGASVMIINKVGQANEKDVDPPTEIIVGKIKEKNAKRDSGGLDFLKGGY